MVDKFKMIIAPGVVSIATSGLIFQMMYLFENFKFSNELLLKTLSITLYTLCFISYYVSIKAVKLNNPPENLLIPRKKCFLKFNHPMYVQVKKCERERHQYKPVRTSHCHVCGCVMRMDHHCPYIGGCVGLRNLKPFFLFCFYGGVFALQFTCLSGYLYYSMLQGAVQKLQNIEVTIWIILTCFGVFLTLSMLSLAVSLFVMTLKNMTTLDLLKRQFRFNDKTGNNPNPFDLGMLTNLSLLFGYDPYLFWFPTINWSDNDGTAFPQIPPIGFFDRQKLPDDLKTKLSEMDFIKKNMPKSIQELRAKQFDNYKDIIFFYLGEQYRLNKEHLQEPKQQQRDNKIVIKKQMSQEEEKMLQDVYSD